MFRQSVFTFLMVAVCRVSSRRLTCQMMSLQTENGIGGYCCVFLQNTSDSDTGEEIKQQILISIQNETQAQDEVVTSVRGGMPPPPPPKGKIINHHHHNPGKINFPGATSSHSHLDHANNSNVTTAPVPEKTNTNGTVIPVNRNAVDTPETCPDGNEKDHNGNCVPVF